MNNPVASTASKLEALTTPKHGGEQSATAVSPNMNTTSIKAMAEHLVRNVAAAGDQVMISAHIFSARRITLEAERTNRIYIAGPMTGLPDLNFPAFHDQAEKLRDLGWHVENPAEHGVVEGAEWGDYLRYDIGRLASCEAVWLLPGWSTSKGAQLEMHIALALGMTVIGSLGDRANKGSTPDAEPAPAKATGLDPKGLEELAQKWEKRSQEALPTDAMLINLHIRELREAIAATQVAAGAPGRCIYCDGSGHVDGFDGEWCSLCKHPDGSDLPDPAWLPVGVPLAVDQAAAITAQEGGVK